MDYKILADDICEWIVDRVAESRTEGVALGLSGGIDSSVVLALARKALGDEVVGVIMPCESNPEDAEHARAAAEAVGAESMTVPLTDAYRTLLDVLPVEEDALARANVKARLRMASLYYVANCRHFLVAGTGNRSELAVGYFTKYGDGGADILPIGGLLKTQVRRLARTLGVPEAIIEKPPSAGLWAGQTDEEEMGIDYPTLDEIVDALESGRTPDAGPEQVEKVRSLMKNALHKLNTPPVPDPV